MVKVGTNNTVNKIASLIDLAMRISCSKLLVYDRSQKVQNGLSDDGSFSTDDPVRQPLRLALTCGDTP